MSSLRLGAAASAGTVSALSGLSRCLLALHASGDQPLGMLWMAQALERLRPLVPFERAWWGECSEAVGDEPPLNWQNGSIGLAADFAEEWNAIGADDEFARASMQRLGEVVCVSGHDAASSAIEDFSRRHELFHCMALTLELPDSGLMFFVSLYRGEAESAFGTLDATLFGEYCLHLAQIWRGRLQEELRQASVSGGEGLGLCEASGQLLYLGHGLARTIRRAFPSWQGSWLPPSLVARFGERPLTLRLGREPVTVTPCGELVALAAGARPESTALAPRERAVALLYAQGQSYKQIAARLGLSPATVRTYLRDAYLQLGVRNKVELGARLSRPD